LTFLASISILLSIKMQRKSSFVKALSAELTFVVMSDAEKPSRTFKVTRLRLALFVLLSCILIGAVSVFVMIDTPVGELIMPEYFSTKAAQLEKVRVLESKIERVQNQLSYVASYNAKLRNILGDTLSSDSLVPPGITPSGYFTAAQAQHSAEDRLQNGEVTSVTEQAGNQSETAERGSVSGITPGSSANSPENQGAEAYQTPMNWNTRGSQQDMAIFPLLMPAAGFVTRNVDYSIQHYGLDISAPQGESIIAPAPGEVIFEDWTLTGGNTLIIVHADDYMTVYKHCERILVSVGTKVSRGEPIALVGSTGITSTGPHLHFELWQDGKNLNPENYLLTKN
jgi:murein DD-endopeptidase MepM/ murein hydrolase activator NlpD